jgi:hypothetical protein
LATLSLNQYYKSRIIAFSLVLRRVQRCQDAVEKATSSKDDRYLVVKDGPHWTIFIPFGSKECDKMDHIQREKQM